MAITTTLAGQPQLGMAPGQSRILPVGQTPPLIQQGPNLPVKQIHPADPRAFQPTVQPTNQVAQPVNQPQFGLAGSEQALQAGLGAGVSALEQAQQGALGTLGAGQNIAQQQLQQGVNALGGNFSAAASQVDPNTGQPLFQQAAQGVGAFSPAGLQAQNLQSALSGAQGQEAFNQALLNSPVQQFLREQGEQSLINQAAATGGLGGGEVQRELARFGQGLAGTQLQQQIANLQALSGQGLQAAGQQGQFLSQAGQQQGNLAAQNAQLGTQANLASAANRLGAARSQAGLFGQGAGITSALAGQGAGIQSGLGQQAANLFAGTGGQLSQGRLQTGRDLASQIGGTTSALAQLQNQQGSGLSDIIGQGGSNLANLLSGAGQLTAGQQTQLAQLLANIATQSGSNIAGAQQQIGQAQAGGELGRSGAFGNLVGQGLGLTALGGGFDKDGIFGSVFR